MNDPQTIEFIYAVCIFAGLCLIILATIAIYERLTRSSYETAAARIAQMRREREASYERYRKLASLNKDYGKTASKYTTETVDYRSKVKDIVRTDDSIYMTQSVLYTDSGSCSSSSSDSSSSCSSDCGGSGGGCD